MKQGNKHLGISNVKVWYSLSSVHRLGSDAQRVVGTNPFGLLTTTPRSDLYYLSATIMKRSASPLASNGTRKSLRLAEKPRTFVWQKQFPKSAPNGDELDLCEAHDLCEKYNLFLPFAQNNISLLKSSGPCRYATAMAETVQEIDNIVKDTKKKLKMKYLQLRTNLDRFARSTLSIPEAYGDLFCSYTG